MSKLKCFKNKISKSLKSPKEDLEEPKIMYATLIRYTSNHFRVYDTKIIEVFDDKNKLKEYIDQVMDHIISIHPNTWDRNNWIVRNYPFYIDDYHHIGIDEYTCLYYKYYNTEIVKLEINNNICRLNDPFNSILTIGAK